MWQFWIDVGGTFTDCLAVAPDGTLTQFKTLSSGLCRGVPHSIEATVLVDERREADPDGFWEGSRCRLRDASGEIVHESHVVGSGDSTIELRTPAPASANSYELDPECPAPVLGIRWLLGVPATGEPEELPAVDVRFGTTRGTNALLTRSGAPTVLLTTMGFRDLPLIGNQDRPELFATKIERPELLHRLAVEVEERIDADGQVLNSLDTDQTIRDIRSAGVTSSDSIAICLINAWKNSEHEERLEQALREAGFQEVSRSSEVSPQIRMVPRCDTTILDAYLNPVLRAYLDDIRAHLPGSRIQVMTSVGGLVDSTRFRGRDCILSGPAGGIVGFAEAGQLVGEERTIGFDMGGTSTDVARFDGSFEIQNETTKAGVRIMTPVLAIETVAAGGGSICRFDGTRLQVGPQSAGADPGPACYGAGGPLTVTDLNVWLGRVLPDHFPFQLDLAAVERHLTGLQTSMARAGLEAPEANELAEGLLQIANDNMVQAVRCVSVAEGYHPSDYALVVFGGAGGQHACAVARSLGMNRVIIHPCAGILSAWGMGHAKVRSVRQISFLRELTPESLTEVAEVAVHLAAETQAEIQSQGIPKDAISDSSISLELRYRGTDTSLTVREPDDGSWTDEFERRHRQLFGYIRGGQPIEIASVRVESASMAEEHPTVTTPAADKTENSEVQTTTVFHAGSKVTAQVYVRRDIAAGMTIHGPAIICEPTSTVFIEPEWAARISNAGSLIIDLQNSSHTPEATRQSEAVTLEVMNNQFVSIATQMGETLRRTSTSTNVRERLDFSCALFDGDGQLVVNAPHVPVHLGAMGETVRHILHDHPQMQRGDVFVTNDPYRGGSHLPDVTVVTPVFATKDSQNPDFFVANRAHHAEIGGVAPGSMPPFSTSLAEEGVLIQGQHLVRAGHSCEETIRELLTTGQWPSRAVDDNLADLAAQVAANECGVRLLTELAEQTTSGLVQKCMRQIQATSSVRMRQCLQKLEDRTYEFTDQLDDGSPIHVAITVSGDIATVDFTGTGPTHSGNLNANRAITTAAVLYSFRCLLNEDVPLNAGVLEPITIVLPDCLLNPRRGETPQDSPAIVGGNVETSQRIVDVLFGALKIAAASQGTMNNLTFGNQSFGYYETICGGSGGSPEGAGASGVHTHMTNTRLTDPEVLENRYPVRLQRFGLRRGSGGDGSAPGGDGIIREIEVLESLSVSMLSQRRTQTPWGLDDGEEGAPGRNTLVTTQGELDLGGCFSRTVTAGEILRIETPGGGGFGGPGRSLTQEGAK